MRGLFGGGLRSLLSWVVDAGKAIWEDICSLLRETETKWLALGAAVLTVAGLAYFGSAIMVNGLIAGALVSGAVGVIVWKVRHTNNVWLLRIYNAAVRNPLITDVLISLVALTVAPAGITGWIAASVAALLASVWLFWAEEAELPEVAEPKRNWFNSLVHSQVEGA
jgi:hypothetical protein